MKVALLTGGRSLERGVSLRSGMRVADSLSGLGHEVVQLDLGPKGKTAPSRPCSNSWTSLTPDPEWPPVG
jgi:D-alanine-D-alanine ligase-like ATP-grasp enzyme